VYSSIKLVIFAKVFRRLESLANAELELRQDRPFYGACSEARALRERRLADAVGEVGKLLLEHAQLSAEGLHGLPTTPPFHQPLRQRKQVTTDWY